MSSQNLRKKRLSDLTYQDLEDVLMEARDRAAKGKGRVRHASDGTTFGDQSIFRTQRAVGRGFALGQIMKKAEEANRFMNEQYCEELMDICVYAVAAILFERYGDDD